MDKIDHKGIPSPFSITFVTANRKKGTGGEFRTYSGCILSKNNMELPLHQRSSTFTKAPRHFENATRNIQTPEGDIIKVHIRLIKRVNGQDIIW